MDNANEENSPSTEDSSSTTASYIATEKVAESSEVEAEKSSFSSALALPHWDRDPEQLLICVLHEPFKVRTRQEASVHPVTGEVLFVAETLVLSADSPPTIEFRPVDAINASATEGTTPCSSTNYTAFAGVGGLLIRRVTAFNRGVKSHAFMNMEHQRHQYGCRISVIGLDGRVRRASQFSIRCEVAIFKTGSRFKHCERMHLFIDAEPLCGNECKEPLSLESQLTLRDGYTTFDENIKTAYQSSRFDVRAIRTP